MIVRERSSPEVVEAKPKEGQYWLHLPRLKAVVMVAKSREDFFGEHECRGSPFEIAGLLCGPFFERVLISE